MNDSIAKNHEPLFDGVARKLGDIHRMLIEASDELESKTRRREGGGPTDLEVEVGQDEIHWWVFRKEPNIAELMNNTNVALICAQKLKEDSKILSKSPPDSYGELVSLLVHFLQTHNSEIDCLHEYLSKLRRTNPLAPTILYTYRVWGSTRRSDRSVVLDCDGDSAQPLVDNSRYIEVVCGLRHRDLYTIERVEYEIGSEIADSLDPGDPASYEPIQIPKRKLFLRTAHRSLLTFAEYFEMIRDSLRNVLLDIDKYNEQKDLMRNDAFWRKFIQFVKDLPRPEHQQWDFKEVLDMWKIKSRKEKDDAEVKFAELVAGFANAEGGVIVVGVTDRSPRIVEGVGDDQAIIEHRLKYTREVISEYVKYSRDIVQFHLTPIDDRAGTQKHCLVIAVAQASEAVAVKDAQNRFTYPIRLETGLSRVGKQEIVMKKLHLKADSYDFVQGFNRMLYDR